MSRHQISAANVRRGQFLIAAWQILTSASMPAATSFRREKRAMTAFCVATVCCCAPLPDGDGEAAMADLFSTPRPVCA